MNRFLKNLLINLCVSTSLFTAATTMEKWAPENIQEQIVEKKEQNKKDFKNRVEVMNAKKDKARVDFNNRKADRNE